MIPKKPKGQYKRKIIFKLSIKITPAEILRRGDFDGDSPVILSVRKMLSDAALSLHSLSDL